MGYKFLIVSRGNSPEVQELQEAAARQPDVDLAVSDITDPNVDLSEYDAVYWRSATVTKRYAKAVGRTMLLSGLPEDVVFFNSPLRHSPQLVNKSVQQVVLAKKQSVVPGIDTYLAADEEELRALVTEGGLQYPFIAKPNHGSRGVGVSLVEDEAGILQLSKLNSLVFQNFIANDGDFRVIVVGGVVLDIIKRKPTDESTHEYLNNLSQGGVAESVDDPALYNKLTQYGELVSAAFGLEVCGIDFVRDKETDEIHFLEINSVPQWEIFRPVLKVDVAHEVIALMKRFVDRKRGKEASQAVRTYYDEHWKNMSTSKQFHYLSRMHFFFPEADWYLNELHAIKCNWLPSTDTLVKKLSSISHSVPAESRTGGREFRRPYYQRHHKIYPYNGVFFKLLFLKTIYREQPAAVLESFDQEDLNAVKDALFADPQAYLALSTHAVNFTYHCDHFFWNDTFNPQYIYDLKDISSDLTHEQRLDSLLYLFTHAIIGATKFYAQPVCKHQEIYRAMYEVLEQRIRTDYVSISLDQKFEIMTCAKLLGIKTDLKQQIVAEAQHSLSPLGDFFVDTINVGAVGLPSFKTAFGKSEHRSVLGIYALS